MNDFKTGDVVMLKSGGPKMTVSNFIKMNKEVTCKWFNKDNQINSDLFNIEMLDTV